ncbi:hypothetical protein BDM02DRAFT_3124634 [Thelephora ganbajun]|uniref:Uncharacterized protein n=1 Tax=Thelephora ganbajun TaxID=370292 RepID=A0ACB6YYI0_THEGA|nr:hypothetical protein BDM02DRAFT_3124634 [Thelephora ganbajun]
MSNRPTLPPLRNPCSNPREQMTALRVNDTNDTYDSLDGVVLLLPQCIPSLHEPQLTTTRLSVGLVHGRRCRRAFDCA